jgi:hypothetical protein
MSRGGVVEHEQTGEPAALISRLQHGVLTLIRRPSQREVNGDGRQPGFGLEYDADPNTASARGAGIRSAAGSMVHSAGCGPPPGIASDATAGAPSLPSACSGTTSTSAGPAGSRDTSSGRRSATGYDASEPAERVGDRDAQPDDPSVMVTGNPHLHDTPGRRLINLERDHRPPPSILGVQSRHLLGPPGSESRPNRYPKIGWRFR